MRLFRPMRRWRLRRVAALYRWLARTVAVRAPDVRLYGADTVTPFLDRWNLIPRNWLLALYLHRFRASDPIPHDHPYTFNASLLLAGAYTERYPVRGGSDRRQAGDFILRFGASAHAVELDTGADGAPAEVWSLFLTGPRFRVWGFYCPNGWTPWHIAVGLPKSAAAHFAKNPNPPVCP